MHSFKNQYFFHPSPSDVAVVVTPNTSVYLLHRRACLILSPYHFQLFSCFMVPFFILARLFQGLLSEWSFPFFPAQSADVPRSPNGELAVVPYCCERTSVIKLRDGMATLWNSVEARVVCVPLLLQLYLREFFCTQVEWPPCPLPLKGTS